MNLQIYFTRIPLFKEEKEEEEEEEEEAEEEEEGRGDEDGGSRMPETCEGRRALFIQLVAICELNQKSDRSESRRGRNL
jgi:hypothetical protein